MTLGQVFVLIALLYTVGSAVVCAAEASTQRRDKIEAFFYFWLLAMLGGALAVIFLYFFACGVIYVLK